LENLPEASWIVERLDGRHDRKSFDCGNPLLSHWLRTQASQYEKKDLARTYVAVSEGQFLVVGYYAISSHRVSFDVLPEELAKGLPRISIPVILLGRLAVDLKAQKRGLGGHLLVDALRRAQHISEQIGARAVEVDAVDDDAREFYLHFGFQSLLDDARHLYISMRKIRKLNLPPFVR
jgi:GNAT superfamily N-acetyltransferase